MNTTMVTVSNLLPRVSAVVALVFAVSAHAQTDADLLAAKAAFEKADRARLAAVAPRLGGHALAPYAEYWQLKLALGDSSPAAIRSFIDRYPNSPLADRLRADWLKALARKGLWDRFALDYAVIPGDDPELECASMLFRWHRDGEDAIAAAKPLWFSDKATSDLCEPLFAALIKRGDISAADRKVRFRMAVEAGNLRLAQSIGNELPGADRIADREFSVVQNNPLAALGNGEFAWNTGGGRELALLAVERSARADPEAARVAWVKVRDRLPVAERLYGNARIGFYAARQLNPSANAWFREAAGATQSAEANAWRVRAALRAQVWDDVLLAIDAMPDAQRQETTWRYWRARALAAKGRTEEANGLLVALAPEVNFYGQLAAEALGRRFVVPTSAPIVPSAAALAVFAARPEVRRVSKLAELDMRADSLREWQYIVRGQDDDALLLAAEHARRVGLYDRAINTAERTSLRHDYSLRYLAPFRADFDAAAKAHDIDVALLYGIARQESRFIAEIVSSAGAIGLMQLMPGTAKWVAKQTGRADFRGGAQVAQTELNTHFGAYYFKYWLDRLDRMPALAAAAYNAGPGRAQAWRPVAPLEGAIWVETIPFNETRDYVKKVLANAMVYGQSFQTSQEPLTPRLGVVTPRGTGAPGPTAAVTAP